MINRTILVRAFAILLAGASLLAALSPGRAQEAEGAQVKEITIQFVGPATLSRERILANMRTTVGQPYSPQVVEEDIRNLYNTQGISNLRIFSEPVADGVRVVVVVQTRGTVKEIQFQGVTGSREKRLRKEITTKTGAALDEATLEQDRQKLVEFYTDKGFGAVDIQYKVEQDEQTGDATVIFSVAEGSKQIVRSVKFEGNTSVPTKELRKVVKTRPQGLLSIFTKAGRLSQEQLDADVLAIEDLYRSKGYADVSAGEVRTEQVSDARVDVVFTVQEGPLYHVGTVDVDGNVLFTTEELKAALKMNEGAVYSPQGLDTDVKAIRDLYGTRGYVDLTLIPETTPGGDAVVNLTYRVDEGVQSYIQRVNIEGNTRTKDKVIRRELAVAPGDLYNTVLVDTSRKRLENLNYFSRVETYPSETFVPGRKDLNVVVEEKSTGAFNFGAGFSSIDNLVGFVEIQESNFDITRWPPRGGGQRFRARVQYGTRRKDFILSLTEPWFMDRQLAVGGEVFFREATYVSDVYDENRYGGLLHVRKPINPFTSVRGEYRLENISIEDMDDDASDILKREEGDYLRSAISASITNDTRDNLFLTRRGHRIQLSGFGTGGFLGGDVDVYGLNLEAVKYFQLPYDMIFHVVGEVATVDTWGDGDRVPIFDRLFLGGANSLRGFDYREVGPKDEDGEPIGGGSLARLTAELTFPVVQRVRGVVFYDVGFVNSGSFDWSPDDINANVGVGVRLDLPTIGPVRLDFGIPVQSDEFNDSNGKFNFNIGYNF